MSWNTLVLNLSGFYPIDSSKYSKKQFVAFIFYSIFAQSIYIVFQIAQIVNMTQVMFDLILKAINTYMYMFIHATIVILDTVDILDNRDLLLVKFVCSYYYWYTFTDKIPVPGDMLVTGDLLVTDDIIIIGDIVTRVPERPLFWVAPFQVRSKLVRLK